MDTLTPEQVRERTRAWQPTDREKAWEKIGWASSLLQARTLSQQNQRMLFLFTLDGRMQRGRC